MRRLIGLLLQPYAAMGNFGSPRPVWHCLLSAAPTDRVLSDAEWGDIAVDVMLRGLGLSDREDDEGVRQISEGVRWIAVRHAADHIHVVATSPSVSAENSTMPEARALTTKVASPLITSDFRSGSFSTGTKPPAGPAMSARAACAQPGAVGSLPRARAAHQRGWHEATPVPIPILRRRIGGGQEVR